MNLGLIVPRDQCHKIRKLLKESHLLDVVCNLKDLGNGNIAIPLINKEPEQVYGSTDRLLVRNGMEYSCSDDAGLHQTLEKSGYHIGQFVFKSKKAKVKTPYENLVSEISSLLFKNSINITSLLQKEIPRHWEKHGDLALLPGNCFRDDVWKHLGDKLWSVVCTCLQSSRLAKKDVISTDGFRTPQVTMLHGESGWVEHIDNSIRYTYDITKCMFSAGNVTEKLRIANFDCSREVVVDLYAGIGYFTLPYLVHAGARHVHACEWNPDAVEALEKNLRLNGVEDRCTVYHGDNRKMCLKSIANRVNLGLIPNSEDGWLVACTALKPSGGFLHIHSNVETKDRIKCDNNERNSTCNCKDVNNTNKTENSSENTEKNESIASNVSCDQCVEKCESQDQISRGQSVRKRAWREWAETVCKTIRDMMCTAHSDVNWRTSICHIEHVKSYAPHVDHLVLDLKCQPV